jgi:hypothetical protein
MKIAKTIQVVLAIVLVTTAAANAAEPKIKIKIKVRPFIILAGLSLQVQNVSMGAQVKDDLLNGTEKFAQGASKVTDINLDPTTMGLISSHHGPDADMADKLDLIVIHSFSYDKPGMYNADEVEAIRKKLEDGSWSCPIHVRNEDGSSDMCSRSSEDHVTNEMVLISIRPQKLTFIHLRGKLTLSELNEMSRRTGSLTPH